MSEVSTEGSAEFSASEEQIRAAIRDLIAARLKVAPETISLDSDLLQEVGLDSFDLMDAVLEIEELFPPVSLSDSDAQELRTIRELAAYIDRQRGVD